MKKLSVLVVSINVPASFYESVVWPAFSRAPGIAYVLPETKPLHAVFAGLPSVPDVQTVKTRSRRVAS